MRMHVNFSFRHVDLGADLSRIFDGSDRDRGDDDRGNRGGDNTRDRGADDSHRARAAELTAGLQDAIHNYSVVLQDNQRGQPDSAKYWANSYAIELHRLVQDDGKIHLPAGGVTVPGPDGKDITFKPDEGKTTISPVALTAQLGTQMGADPDHKTADMVAGAVGYTEEERLMHRAIDPILREGGQGDDHHHGGTHSDSDDDADRSISATADRVAHFSFAQQDFSDLLKATTPKARNDAIEGYLNGLKHVTDTQGRIVVDGKYTTIRDGKAVAPIPNTQDNPYYTRDTYTKMLAEQYGADPAVVQKQIDDYTKGVSSPSVTPPPIPANGPPTRLGSAPAPDPADAPTQSTAPVAPVMVRDTNIIEETAANFRALAPGKQSVALLLAGRINYNGQKVDDVSRAQAALNGWASTLKPPAAGATQPDQDRAFRDALGFRTPEQAEQAFTNIAATYDAATNPADKQKIVDSYQGFLKATQAAYPAVAGDVQKQLDLLQNPSAAGQAVDFKGMLKDFGATLKALVEKFSAAIQTELGASPATPATPGADPAAAPPPAGGTPDAAAAGGGAPTPPPPAATTPTPAQPAVRFDKGIMAVLENMGWDTGKTNHSLHQNGAPVKAEQMDGVIGSHMTEVDDKIRGLLHMDANADVATALKDSHNMDIVRQYAVAHQQDHTLEFSPSQTPGRPPGQTPAAPPH